MYSLHTVQEHEYIIKAAANEKKLCREAIVEI